MKTNFELMIDFIAEQYERNLFVGCKTLDDVESVLCDVETDKFDTHTLVTAAYYYIKERE